MQKQNILRLFILIKDEILKTRSWEEYNIYILLICNGSQNQFNLILSTAKNLNYVSYFCLHKVKVSTLKL